MLIIMQNRKKKMISRDNVDILLSECQAEKEIAEQTLKEMHYDAMQTTEYDFSDTSKIMKQIAVFNTVIELCEYFNDMENKK